MEAGDGVLLFVLQNPWFQFRKSLVPCPPSGVRISLRAAAKYLQRVTTINRWPFLAGLAFAFSFSAAGQAPGIEVRFLDPQSNQVQSFGQARRLTLTAGYGIQLVATKSQPPDDDVTITVSVDTALIASVKRVQSGQPSRCFPSGSSGAGYTCNMLPMLENYERGQPLILFPDVTCRDNPTLNIAGLGARTIRKKDTKGLVSLQAGDLIAGVPYLLISTADEWVVMR